MLNVKMFVFVLCYLSLTFGVAFANVIIIGNNVTRSFQGFEANFAQPMKESGEYGKLYLADPLDACSKLTNKVNGTGKDTMFSFALIIRGVCSFEAKVRKAQQAGFKAAIIFDNVDGVLFEIAGNSDGIRIHAMFVSKMSGEILVKYAVVDRDVEVLIVPNFENSTWSIMATSFVSLLAISAVLASCFIVRRHRIRRERPRRASQVREFHGMSSHLVKAMPSLIFTSVLDDRCTSMTCAICLEDYTVGEKLRLLPCCHKFHASCVDAWLTTWRTFCPVCKRDARTSSCDPPPSEWTPLFSVSSRVSIPSSSSSSSSLRSSISSSPAIQIYPSSSPWIPQIHSASAISYYAQEQQQQQHSVQSYRHSPFTGATIRNASSYRSVASPHSSAGYPLSVSPPYYPSFVDRSSSSGRHHNNALHCSESADSFLPYDSAQSLPGC